MTMPEPSEGALKMCRPRLPTIMLPEVLAGVTAHSLKATPELNLRSYTTSQHVCRNDTN